MHLIEVAKTGQVIPASLPSEFTPPGKNSIDPELTKPDLNIEGERMRSASVSSLGKMDAGE